MKHWTKSYGADVPQEINPDVYASIPGLFEHSVATYGDHPAFTCFGKTLSYSEIDSMSRNIAAYLQNKLGVSHGDRVALMMPNVPAFLIAMLGILRAGAVQVNVNPLYTPRELAHQLIDAEAETMIIFGGSTPVLAEIAAETPIRNIIVADLGDGSGLPIPSPQADTRLNGVLRFADALAEGAGIQFNPVELTGNDLAFLQYTGGTTGLSKGAALSHRNLLANIEQYKAFMPEALEPGKEVVIGALPLYHIFGLMLTLSYISVGGRNILIPNPRDMDAFINAIKDAKFSIMAGVNTLFSGMMMHPAFKEIDLSGYKVAIGGGAAVLPATSEKWKSLTGHHIKEGYGLSETSPVLCINPMSVTAFTGSCGLPVPSTEIKLLKADDTEAEPGEAGEICARGPQVMRGYWNRADANADAFTDDGFFRTGDIGVFDESGFLRIVDRKKDMIIVSGFNVYPNEIEAVAASMDGVAECACFGVPDEKTGEAVALFVVAIPGVEITADTVVAFCRDKLAAYKMPRHIRLVSELPKSNVGKILRRELRDQF
ncbi:long-chain-fatty-acid--CoA ligase [Roseibium aquae]|uniref:Long-chain-fatty-acid--CoA ligase n=1 Tax=Roseibium aquae TaxID=1323746 RepID=A0A916X2W8_9HYPH|nr:AMP-binding protein [Roseibium aquae]GGB56977.1 long-chain-fatty-acid--CoA ligase [Roseibium aquae]